MRGKHHLHVPLVILGLVLLALGPAAARGAGLPDSEAATHRDTAAWYELVHTYQGSGYQVQQFSLGVLSHYSYLLISGKEALVVDPGRDVDAYLEAATKAGAAVKGVFLTHSHADFVAGHLELAKAASCPVYINARTAARFPHQALDEGSMISIGDAQLRFLETPGHTPDGLCGVVSGKSAPDRQEILFTGDTLFVGSVGRPDLMGGTTSAAELAGMMFDTWNLKLSKLPDSVTVLPAHGAGSLCGAHLSSDPSSTIGRERNTNPYLKFAHDRSAFIAALLDGLPDAPAYFQHDARMNHDGPPLVDWHAPLPAHAMPDAELSQPDRWFVVDLRPAREYAAGHIPNSVNIALRGRLETWVGMMVPWEAKLLLVGGREELTEAIHRLHRVGYQAGVIAWETWKQSGLPQRQQTLVTPAELQARMKKGDAPVIVDVRLPSEWAELRIGQVVNLPLNELGTLAPKKLDRRSPVVTVCNSAYRSTLAIGILERAGFQQVTSLDGGSEAWIEAGLPVIGGDKAAAPEPSAGETSESGPPAPLRRIPLPDRISAAELKRLALDLPGTFELVDIRPAALAADYNPLRAKLVDVGTLLTDPAFLAGEVPLIIVDRDGSVAMMVAGILSQKTKRPIKVLHRGMEAYWAESELQPPGPLPEDVTGPTPSGKGTGGGAGGDPGGGVAPAAPGEQGAPPEPGSAPAAPAKPKKKSAGC